MVAGRPPLSGVVYDGRCFGCGALNDEGLQMHFEPVAGGVACDFDVPERYQSWQGMIHGGIVALMLDEAVGWAAWHAGSPGLTGRLEVKYRRPLEARQRVRVTGRVERSRRSLVYTSASIETGDGELIAEATATLMAVPAQVSEAVPTMSARRGLAQSG